MNWILLLVLLTLVLSVIHGYWKGFLRIVYSLVSWILVLVFVSWATPYIHQFLLERTEIYERVEAHCEETMRESAGEQTQEIIRQTGERLGDGLGIQDTGLADLGMRLPDSVVNGIMEKTAGAADEFLETNGVYTMAAQGMADFIVKGISFLLALIMAGILVHLIERVLGIVSHIPILKGVNRFLGLFAGGLHGLLLVWLAFYVIALCSAGEAGKVFTSYIYESPFLTFLYENNLVLTIIMNIF